jgi:hypothetical protein
MDMTAGGISSSSFALIIVFSMVLVLPGYLLAYRTGRDIYRANAEELGSEAAQDRQWKEIPPCPRAVISDWKGLSLRIRMQSHC